MLLLACALVIAGIFAFRTRQHPLSGESKVTSSTPVSTLPVKSIAVLPFENLSADPENAYVASGIQEEILSNLAQIADLKVISRTSSNLYRTENPRNAREIGQELGVAHLLEGSVQRSGEHLRVHVQLIDTRNDSHLWAQTFDRNLADIFAIQSEIARSIAGQLQARISEREKAAIAQPATSDLIANALYAQALALDAQFPERENGLKALDLLERAVERDPRFLLAFCELGRIHLAFYFAGFDHTATRLELANNAIQKAAQIQPDAGEVHLIRASYFGLALRDYDRARTELDLARRSLPNNPAVYYQTAVIDRRQGHWTEAVKGFEQALELDPRNVQFLLNTASTYEGLRRYADAAQLCRRAVAVSPRDHHARIMGAWQPFYERADIRPLRAELNAILAEEPNAAPKIADSLYKCAILERDVAAADRALAVIPPEGLPAEAGILRPREWYVGYVARIFNRPEIARASLEAMRTNLEKLLREQPDYAAAWSQLGRAEAALGRKEEAINAGRRAVELLPLSSEAVSGLRPLWALTRIYAWVGEEDLALEQLADSAEQPVGIDYGNLQLHPDWDLLRGDPRFEKIVASLAPKPENNRE